MHGLVPPIDLSPTALGEFVAFVLLCTFRTRPISIIILSELRARCMRYSSEEGDERRESKAAARPTFFSPVRTPRRGRRARVLTRGAGPE